MRVPGPRGLVVATSLALAALWLSAAAAQAQTLPGVSVPSAKQVVKQVSQTAQHTTEAAQHAAASAATTTQKAVVSLPTTAPSTAHQAVAAATTVTHQTPSAATTAVSKAADPVVSTVKKTASAVPTPALPPVVPPAVTKVVDRVTEPVVQIVQPVAEDVRPVETVVEQVVPVEPAAPVVEAVAPRPTARATLRPTAEAPPPPQAESQDDDRSEPESARPAPAVAVVPVEPAAVAAVAAEPVLVSAPDELAAALPPTPLVHTLAIHDAVRTQPNAPPAPQGVTDTGTEPVFEQRPTELPTTVANLMPLDQIPLVSAEPVETHLPIVSEAAWSPSLLSAVAFEAPAAPGASARTHWPTSPPAPTDVPAAPPPPVTAPASLLLGTPSAPGAAPPILASLSLTVAWHAIWVIARLRPPGITLPNLAPPG